MNVRVLQAEGLTDAADPVLVSAERPVQPAELAVADGAGVVGVAVVHARTGVVVLTGRLDATTVGDVRARLHELAHQGSGDFVLDVSGTEVGDATGLGMFVGLHRAAERCERHLVLQGVPPRLMRMLRATKLHRILRVASATLIGAEVVDPNVEIAVSAAC